ncbi:MAG: hypothetical protein GX259_07245 [Bacteroidales bacterium]|nr:hypothetical protein [Bacteroidales bacterium]
MKDNLILSNIIRFIIVFLLQALLFNYLNIFGFINPSFYLYFVLLIPFETPVWLLLIISFFTGLTQDIFVSTGGIHAAATTAIAGIRPFLSNIIIAKKEYEAWLKPNLSDLGWKSFLAYSSIIIAVHSLIVTLLDVFRFSNFLNTLKNTFLLFISTLFFILLCELLININKKKKRR